MEKLPYAILHQRGKLETNFRVHKKRKRNAQQKRLRIFIEAVWYIVRSGCQWRLLPKTYGNYRSIHKRFKKRDIWKKLLAYSKQEPDLEVAIIDSTSPSMCIWIYKKLQEALGRSKGGFTTKIHALVDALGNPLEFTLTPGQRNEITQAQVLTESIYNSTV